MTTSILGTAVKRVEDPRLLTGQASYIDNLALPGAAYLAFARSPIAHARVVGIDVAEALAAPGVVAVFSWADLAAAGVTPQVPLPMADTRITRPWLADGTVRFVGEPVVAIVAESRAAAVDAAELVVVDYDPLPALVDPEAAARDEVLLFPFVGTNVAARLGEPPPPDHFAGCEVVVEARILNPRLAPVPLEVRTVASRWDVTDGDARDGAGDGAEVRLTHWASTQVPHSVKGTLVDTFGLRPDQVRVIVPDVGGGFGAKFLVTGEELICAWAARQLGRPVRWQETRTENLTNMPHGRAQTHRARLGGTRDGHLIAYELEVLQDAGAYPNLATFMPHQTTLMASGPYAIERVAAHATAVATTTTPVGAYRGAGRPEATATLERMVDLYAAEAGIDRVELRRANLLDPSAFPYTTPTGAAYDSGEYLAALDAVLAHAGYDALRDEQARRRAAGDRELIGIGVACYVEITNGPGSGEHAEITVGADGRAVVLTGTSPHGQGHDTAWAMIAADTTGIPVSAIEVRHGDTDEVPVGGGTGGSRSLQAGGVAVQQAAEQLVDQARQRAADRLEAFVGDIVLDVGQGTFGVVGTPSVALTWGELADEAELHVALDSPSTAGTFPFGAHVAVVEVDQETGAVRLVRYTSVDDAGTVVNPMLFDGQVQGGIASGAAQALMEVFMHDSDGNPLTSTLADYGLVSAAELPFFTNHRQETPTPHNRLGVKGIGEAGTIGATPAVHSAVVDALAPFGVRHLDLPLTAERVWRAMRAATGEGAGDG